MHVAYNLFIVMSRMHCLCLNKNIFVWAIYGNNIMCEQRHTNGKK